MANILPKEKQIMVIGALAEGNSIRSIERMTGIHRDTVMRLGVRVGQGCKTILVKKLLDLHSLFPNKTRITSVPTQAVHRNNISSTLRGDLVHFLL